jgi:hypothetical protein
MARAETAAAASAPSGFAVTGRKDNWWVGPLATGLALGAFGVYATLRAFHNDYYELGAGAKLGYVPNHAYLLSPFYSPLLTGLIPSSMAWLSPALLILWAPGGFRLTCYYYRKAYYRAFFLDPAGCAVGEPASFCGVKRGLAYQGETKLLLFQNLHRIFLYVALVFLVLLATDVVHSCIWPDGFGVSVGTLVLLANTTLLTLYTFSCHSLRHLVGGCVDCFSRSPGGAARHKLWTWTTVLNERHMLWAWTSLFMVGFADFYVWMVASGRISDWRII